MKCVQARNLERGRNVWIQLIHAVVTLGLRCIDFVAQTDIQRESLADLPVVLDESGELKGLRAGEVRHLILTPGARAADAGEVARYGIAPARKRGTGTYW